jgi:hypothetical protein
MDINSDVWNWCAASSGSFQHFDWRNNLRDAKDIEIYDKIKILDKKPATIIVKKYLKEMYVEQKKNIYSFKKYILKSLDKDFLEACEWLENVTKNPLAVKGYEFIITTFPRCPYNSSTGTIFINFSRYNKVMNPISLFLHEALHFQFHHYWQHNKNSPVSKLSNDDFHFLKESLTVILDDELIPLIGKADWGYPKHQAFRKELHKEWLKHHDFDKLVDFGLKKLPEFLVKS